MHYLFKREYSYARLELCCCWENENKIDVLLVASFPTSLCPVVVGKKKTTHTHTTTTLKQVSEMWKRINPTHLQESVLQSDTWCTVLKKCEGEKKIWEISGQLAGNMCFCLRGLSNGVAGVTKAKRVCTNDRLAGAVVGTQTSQILEKETLIHN